MKTRFCTTKTLTKPVSSSKKIFLRTSRALWQIARERGTYLPLAPAGEAVTEAESAGLGERIQALYRDAMAGEPAAVATRIRTLATELEIDEVAVVTWTHDETVRRQSYALLAQAFALQAS